MNVSKTTKRKRGVILTLEGLAQLRAAIQAAEQAENDGNRYTLEELGNRIRVAPKTVGKVMEGNISIDRRTLELCFDAFGLELRPRDYQLFTGITEAAEMTGATAISETVDRDSDGADRNKASVEELEAQTHRVSWGEAPDVSCFWGRRQELTRLSEWIMADHCRLILLLGRGGMGKTALATKLAQELQDEFDFVIWRSLRNAPPLNAMLNELILCLSRQQEARGDIARLLHYLRTNRCLLVLDNVEAILQGGEQVGRYQLGYEDYGELFRIVGDAPHQSCLLLTSREKPLEIAAAEGVGLAVRTDQLGGVPEAAPELFKAKGLSGSAPQQQALGQRYTYNPLALKLVSTAIHDIFGGDIGKFLEQDTTIFDGPRQLLDRQFERLSPLEKNMMYWLAINREWTDLATLQSDLVPPVSRASLMECITSLKWRSLIEQQADRYTQQPVVMEYVGDRLVEQISREIGGRAEDRGQRAEDSSALHPATPSPSPPISLFSSHALTKTNVKDYIREAQVRLFLQPIADRLQASYSTSWALEQQMRALLEQLRQTRGTNRSAYAGGNLLALCYELDVDVTGFDCSDLPIWQADLQGMRLQRVNFSNANFARSIFTHTFGAIFSVAFSPDGTQVAAGNFRGEVRIKQVADLQSRLNCVGHTSRVTAVSWSPDGQKVASGGVDRTIKLWDSQTGELLNTFIGHTNCVSSVSWHPNGRVLVSGSEDGLLHLWDVQTGDRLRTLSGHTGGIWSVQFSPDGQGLVSSSSQGNIRLWAAETGECLSVLQDHQDGVWSVRFSPDGRFLASGSDDHTVRIWDVNTGTVLRTMQGHTNWVFSIVWSPDGQRLASASGDRTIRLWNVQTGQVERLLQGHTNAIWSVDWSANGEFLLSGSEDRTIRLWSVATGQVLSMARGYTSGIRSLAWAANPAEPQSPDHLLVSGGEDNIIRLWDTQTGRVTRRLRGHTNRVHSLDWSAAALPEREPLLASSSEDQTIKVWHIGLGKAIKTLQGHTDRVWSVAWRGDGQVLASSSQDQTVRLWNVQVGQVMKILRGHQNGVNSVQFSPDGQVLASGSEDHSVKLWHGQTGELLHSLTGHRDRVLAVCFHPNGQLLASSSEDQTIRLWHLPTAACLTVLHGHSNRVLAIQFSPDGQRLASASVDQTVRLWSVAGECLHVLTGHRSFVWSVVWSPDGQYLASGSEDETIKLWQAKTGECVKTLSIDRPYQRMNITGVTGLSESTIASLKELGAIEENQAL